MASATLKSPRSSPPHLPFKPQRLVVDVAYTFFLHKNKKADNLDKGRERFTNRAFPLVLASFALSQNTRGDQQTKTGGLFWLSFQRLQSMIGWSSCFWARGEEYNIVGVWFGKALTS